MQLWRISRDAEGSGQTGKDEELLDAYSSAVVGVVADVSPSVVHVQVRGSRGGQPAHGSGSGTILSPDGIVLTNNHVVEGAAAIELALNDARRVSARVLGRDPDTDIAVLRAETGDRLPAARLGLAGDQVSLPQRLKIRTGLTQDAGVRVVEVQPGSPAHAGGLEPGDVIVGLDRDTVTGIDDIARLLDGTRIHKGVAVRILRDGVLVTLDIVPTERLPER